MAFVSCGDTAHMGAPASGEGVVSSQPPLTRTLDEPLTVWVVMKPIADLTKVTSRNWTARGLEVYRQLTSTAASSQASLIAFLSTKGIRFQSFWIANTLKITADRNTIAEIARRPEVKSVLPDKIYSMPPVRPGRPQRGVQTVEWGISNVRAPEVWSTFGARGEGIVVASVDSGVQFDHPALVGQYRGNTGSGFDHNYNWFDPGKICPPAPPATTPATAPTPWEPWWATTATPPQPDRRGAQGALDRGQGLRELGLLAGVAAGGRPVDRGAHRPQRHEPLAGQAPPRRQQLLGRRRRRHLLPADRRLLDRGRHLPGVRQRQLRSHLRQRGLAR
jgi:hypothetical protein